MVEMRALGSTLIHEISIIEDLELCFNDIDVIAIFGTNITTDYTDIADAMAGNIVISKDYHVGVCYPTVKESFDAQVHQNPSINPDDVAFYKGEITSITEIISKEEYLMIRRVGDKGYSIVNSVDYFIDLFGDYGMFEVQGINGKITYVDLTDVMGGTAIYCKDGAFYAFCDDLQYSITKHFESKTTPNDMPAVYGFELTTIGELMTREKDTTLHVNTFLECETFEEFCDKAAVINKDYTIVEYNAGKCKLSFDEMSKIINGEAIYFNGYIFEPDFEYFVKAVNRIFGSEYIDYKYFYKGKWLEVSELSKALGVTELKYDQGKVKFSLVPMHKLLELDESKMLDADSFMNAYTSLLTGKNVKEALSYMWFDTMSKCDHDEMIVELAKLYTYGANKYEENSWGDVEVSRYIDAIGRHKYLRGNGNIDESGFHHDVHLLWNILTCYILI